MPANCKQSWARGDCGASTWRPSFASHLDLHGSPSAPICAEQHMPSARAWGAVALTTGSICPRIRLFYVNLRGVPRL